MLTKLKAKNTIQAAGTISAFRQFRAEAYTLFRDETLKCDANGTSKRDIVGIQPYQISKSENMKRHKLRGFELSKFTRQYKGIYIYPYRGNIQRLARPNPLKNPLILFG